MKGKSIVTAVLLVFVAASAVALVIKETRNGPGAAAPMANDEGAALPDNGVVVFYFHGNTRCPTCRSIEAQAHDLVTSRSANELADGQLTWQVVNYETPADAHYVDDYEIVAPIVILSLRRDGTQTDWRSLDRVWELVGDGPAFATYVQQEIGDMLAAANYHESGIPPDQDQAAGVEKQ